MIVFSDIDGTIYDYSGNLADSTIYTIRKLRENNHRVFIVTGRSKAEIKQELWDLGFSGFIGGNGSYIEVDNKVIMHKTLSYKQCVEIVEWLNNHNLGFYLESNLGLFASKTFCNDSKIAINRYLLGKEFTGNEEELVDVRDILYGLKENENLYRDDINKISFLLNNKDDYLNAKKQFKDLVVGTWGGKDDLPLFADISPRDISKANAIKVLLDYLNIGIDDTLAIGDAFSDISMLKLCKIGITFISGCDDIKKVADYISDDVSSDGFYKAFKHYGLI